MKILCVSDIVDPVLSTRKKPERLKDVDLILSCGDLPPEYLLFLANRFEVPLFYILGNHDIRHIGKPLNGCRNIHGRIVTYRGIRLAGLQGSRWYNGGANQYRESEMKRIIRKLQFQLWRKSGIDIVITHAPPRLVHDTEDRSHRGFESFHLLIEKYTPRYFIHGHIHAHFERPDDRITLLSRTRVINCFGHYLLNF